MNRRACAALLTVALIAAGCGGSSSTTREQTSATAAATATATPEAKAISTKLLADWNDRLVPLLVTMRDRARAADKGDSERATLLETRVNRGLRVVRRYGRESRKALLAALDTPQAKATVAAGDAWTHWANELLTNPPAGSFAQAGRIADLAAVAIAKTQSAYRAAGQPIPAAWRSG